MNQVLDALTSLGFDFEIALANLVNFLIIFYLLKRFFFGSIKETLEKRRRVIEEGLKDAEEGAKQLKLAESKKNELLTNAELQAQSIVEDSHAKAQTFAEDIKNSAHTEASAIIDAAKAKNDEFMKASQQELQKKVPELVVMLTEKILREKMTPEENEKYISSLVK